MELDDFKNTWDDLSASVTINENFKPQKLNKMKQPNLKKFLNNIIIPETAGSIVCIAFAIYIGFNFENLTTIAYQIVGIATIVVLLILCAISLMSILPFYKIGNLNKTYSETLKDFATKKVNFFKLQKINFLLTYVLFVLVILLSTRLFGVSTITESKYFFLFTFTFGFSVFLIFSKWASKNYKKSIRTTEELLKDLSN